jgi:6-phosphogluconolactonase (cycloisomerase 2 family)
MKFRKFGKALLMGAVSLSAILSVTSCVQSYTVGFLYVTGTQTTGTSGSAGQGIVSGFKIDHNTGKLSPINGLPISTGGSYPNRAVLLLSSRFLYVLNQGGSDCTTTATDPGCAQANIVQFSVAGNGALIAQQTFYTQCKNPFRLFADATGGHIYALDHDAPDNSSCARALGAGVTTCADITAFNVDPTTGRLSLLLNAQVTAADGSQLTYFPVPSNPIDVLLNANYVFTLSGTPATGNFVFPYAYNSSGQLTLSQNSIQTIGITQATALQAGNSSVYILDNEPLTIPPGTTGIFPPGTYPAQILPYSVGAGGALQPQTGGAVPDVPAQSNPLFLLAESKGKWVYVANAGDNTNATVTNTQSGIAAYVIDTSSHQLTPMSGSPFGSGAGPACLVEDPSNQFIYTANFNDSSVTGSVLDPNVGTLSSLPGKANKTYSLNGPATYCLTNGRTS